MSRFSRCSAVLVGIAVLLSTGQTAHAVVTGGQVTTTTFSEDSVDVGCREQVTVHIEGTRLIHEADVNGGIRTGVDERGTASFTEAGQRFVGRFTRTFSYSTSPGGVSTVTQNYTVTLHGDEGDNAELHIVAHATLLADGTVATIYSILHQSCTGG